MAPDAAQKLRLFLFRIHFLIDFENFCTHLLLVILCTDIIYFCFDMRSLESHEQFWSELINSLPTSSAVSHLKSWRPEMLSTAYRLKQAGMYILEKQWWWLTRTSLKFSCWKITLQESSLCGIKSLKAERSSDKLLLKNARILLSELW